MDTKTNIYKDQAVFTVTRWDGNGDVLTIYEGENETDARDLYKKEVAGAGTPCRYSRMDGKRSGT